MRTKQIPTDSILHACEEYPNEACGVVVAGKYIRCRNDAPDKGGHFIVNRDDYEMALSEGDIEAVIHSHPDYTCRPSAADLRSCLESEVPWAIIEVRKGQYARHMWVDPNTLVNAPLLGRDFHHGVHDCLSIVLDYYKREMGIDLGSYEREDGWWNEGKDYYRDLMPKAGFRMIDPDVDGRQSGDVLLMQIKSPVPNHAAIFLSDGKIASETCADTPPCVILHHMYGALSRRDVYGGYYQEKTVSVWRYGTANPSS